MIHLHVYVQRVGDPTDIFEGIAQVNGPEDVTELPLVKSVIMEHGTVSGGTTIMLIMKDDAGKPFVTQITANHLNAVLGATRGAEMNWAEHKNPFLK